MSLSLSLSICLSPSPSLRSPPCSPGLPLCAIGRARPAGGCKSAQSGRRMQPCKSARSNSLHWPPCSWPHSCLVEWLSTGPPRSPGAGESWPTKGFRVSSHCSKETPTQQKLSAEKSEANSQARLKTGLKGLLPSRRSRDRRARSAHSLERVLQHEPRVPQRLFIYSSVCGRPRIHAADAELAVAIDCFPTAR